MTDRLGYRAVPAGVLHATELAPLVAVYDRRSNQTHLLASPLPELLTAIAGAGPDVVDADAMARRLRAEFAFADEGADPVAVIAERLDELAALGLVDRAAPCVTR